jgi:hypothetical protein
MWQNIRSVAVFFVIVGGLTLSPICSAQDSSEPPPQEGAEVPTSIFVEQKTDCMAVLDIKSALASVLETREEAGFMIVTVVVSPAVDRTLAVLRAIDRETGEILLERTLNIAPEECTNAHLVLKVMLEQFLTGFPIAKWKEKHAEAVPPPPTDPIIKTEKVIVEREVMHLQWFLLAGLDSRWPTPSGDLELSLGLDAGAKRHGVICHLVFRIGWPHRLAEGRYIETAALLALGWRFSSNEKRLFRVEIRAGTLRVGGFGYEVNYYQWLVLMEAQLSLLWRAGSVYLGPEASIAPLFHKVFSESGEQRDLPWIRLGILLAIPLGKTTLK